MEEENHVVATFPRQNVISLKGLGNVTYLLDAAPSNPLLHPLSPTPISLYVIQVTNTYLQSFLFVKSLPLEINAVILGNSNCGEISNFHASKENNFAQDLTVWVTIHNYECCHRVYVHMYG